jgi:hypothetical protein
MQQILQNKYTKNTKQTKSEQKEHHNVHKKIKTNKFTERERQRQRQIHSRNLQFKFYHKIYEDEREFEAFLASQRERERESVDF